jgi:hypothetical protein
VDVKSAAPQEADRTIEFADSNVFLGARRKFHASLSTQLVNILVPIGPISEDSGGDSMVRDGKKKNGKPKKSKFLGAVIKPEPTEATPDDPTRVTRSDHFVAVGGDKEEHARITEISVRVEEGLKRDEKQPHQLSPEEFSDRVSDAIDRTG